MTGEILAIMLLISGFPRKVCNLVQFGLLTTHLVLKKIYLQWLNWLNFYLETKSGDINIIKSTAHDFTSIVYNLPCHRTMKIIIISLT